MYRLEALDVDVKQEIDTYNQERYQSIQIEQDLYKLTETAMSLSRVRFAASLDSNRVLQQHQLESLNQKCSGFSIVNMQNQEIIVSGGLIEQKKLFKGENTHVSDRVVSYVISKNSWKKLPKLNEARIQHSSCCCAFSIYVLCGTNQFEQCVNSIEQLDYTNNSKAWQVIVVSSSLKKTHVAAAIAWPDLVIFGGQTINEETNMRRQVFVNGKLIQASNRAQASAEKIHIDLQTKTVGIINEAEEAFKCISQVYEQSPGNLIFLAKLRRESKPVLMHYNRENDIVSRYYPSAEEPNKSNTRNISVAILGQNRQLRSKIINQLTSNFSESSEESEQARESFQVIVKPRSSTHQYLQVTLYNNQDKKKLYNLLPPSVFLDVDGLILCCQDLSSNSVAQSYREQALKIRGQDFPNLIVKALNAPRYQKSCTILRAHRLSQEEEKGETQEGSISKNLLQDVSLSNNNFVEDEAIESKDQRGMLI